MGDNKTKKERKRETKLNLEKLQKSYYFRDFEIEMYWKRAQYFWSFLAVIYAGYFLLVTSKDCVTIPGEYKLLTAAIGVLMSFAWYLVNRGSKRWQEHWEQMIDKYEVMTDFIVYKDTTAVDTGLIKSGKFSVSKVNIMVSLIIFLSWVYIFCSAVYESKNCISLSISTITLSLLILMGILSRSQN